LKKNQTKELFIVVIIIFTILLSSIKLTFDGYFEFYKDSKKDKKNDFIKAFDLMYDFYPITVFRSYTGLETGYGFFGPNVSSDFIIFYRVFDNNGNLIYQSNFELSSNEGNLRFMSLNKIFLEKITKNANQKYNKLIGIILDKVSEYIAKDYPKSYTINTSVYLYDFPSILDFKKGRKASLYLIKETQWKN
jgi:hypothetical protein